MKRPNTRRTAVAQLALAGIAALAVVAAPAAAQLPEAEDAFGRGDFRTARALYDSALALDSLNPRALYRLAIFDSWDGKLKQSLARFVRLRHIEPLDPETMVAHARVLSWDGRTRWSEALYDSVLALAPDRADALAGRARAIAWSGDLNRAERLWRDALERHPDDPEILTGLAQTLYWEGEPALAEGYIARARELAPADRATGDLFDQLRAQRRPIVSVSSDGTNDIEHQSFVTLSGTFGASLRHDLRGSLRTSLRRNEAGSVTGRSDGVDGWLVKSFPGGATVRGGLGVRVLDPDSGATRRFATAQLGAGLRPARYASVDIAYSHYPFDETASLVRRPFVWDELGVSGDFAPRPNLAFSALANAAWLSDGNRRLIGSALIMVGVAKGLQVGGYARVIGYRLVHPGRRYFAPGRYLLGEGRVAYAWRRRAWGLRATGGLGAQQVKPDGVTQGEWHGDVTVSHSWRAIDELSLVGLYTNSAAARSGTATMSRYWYWSVGVRYRRGL